jgi:hypothetical protein
MIVSEMGEIFWKLLRHGEGQERFKGWASMLREIGNSVNFIKSIGGSLALLDEFL